MALRKYIFWEYEGSIRTYKVTGDNEWELLLPRGNEAYPGGFSAEFWRWFKSSACITSREKVDFCLLSDLRQEWTPEYNPAEQSTWNRQQLIDFCRAHLDNTLAYQIWYGAMDSLLYQVVGDSEDKVVKTLHLQCFPCANKIDLDPPVTEKAKPEEGEASALFLKYHEKYQRRHHRRS